jgi:HSP20 family protein
MTLIKFEPLREMESFNDRIQKFFNEFPSFGLDSVNSFNPRIDISEDDNNIFIDAEIPGVKKEDINISLQDNILTIKGEKKSLKEDKKDKNYFRSERSYGSFTRSFTLPAEVNPDKVEAKFEDGILNVSISKIHPQLKKRKNDRDKIS